MSVKKEIVEYDVSKKQNYDNLLILTFKMLLIGNISKREYDKV